MRSCRMMIAGVPRGVAAAPASTAAAPSDFNGMGMGCVAEIESRGRDGAVEWNMRQARGITTDGKGARAARLALLPSPGTIRRGALDLHNGDRLRAVLQLAAERARWSEPFERLRDGRRWGRGIACNAYHNRTMVAQVAEVSVGTAGDIRVHRVVCAVDCGQVINRSGLEGQFEGGVIWALSAALKGSITFADGQTQQRNFSDFPVLRANEAPVVETHVITSALPPFGVGEQPVPAVAPAVMNAVFAATGKRIRDLPALNLSPTAAGSL